MKTTSSWVRSVGCTAAVVVTTFAVQTAARAQAVSEATSQSLLTSAAAASQPAAAASAPNAAWLRPRALSSLRVVELPPEQRSVGREARKHHALMWRNETLSHALDEAGLTQADCRNRVRLPSRLRSAPGSGRTVEVQMQVALSCSF